MTHPPSWESSPSPGASAGSPRRGAAPQPAVGVLGIQGAVSEHIQLLRKSGSEAFAIRRAEQLHALGGLVLPGGESTAIGLLGSRHGFFEIISRRAKEGMPVWGTCAGMVLLARELEGQQPLLPLLSIRVRRNAYGRQRDSFEAGLEIPVLGEALYPGVFIRAPVVTSCGQEVQVLARWAGRAVAVQEGRLLATSFHPELTEDLRLHRYFLQLVSDAASGKALPSQPGQTGKGSVPRPAGRFPAF